VVECNLAKVEVAGSNPVSRSAKATRSGIEIGVAFFLILNILDKM
jgi:hypothetical protein